MRAIRHERTNILPLRWFANFMDIPAHYLLNRAMDRYYDTNEPEDFSGWDISVSNFIYNRFVDRWGTYYELESNDGSGF